MCMKKKRRGHCQLQNSNVSKFTSRFDLNVRNIWILQLAVPPSLLLHAHNDVHTVARVHDTATRPFARLHLLGTHPKGVATIAWCVFCFAWWVVWQPILVGVERHETIKSAQVKLGLVSHNPSHETEHTSRNCSHTLKNSVHKRRAVLPCAALVCALAAPRFAALANLAVRNADWLIIKWQPIRAVIQERSQRGAARRSEGAEQRRGRIH